MFFHESGISSKVSLWARALVKVSIYPATDAKSRNLKGSGAILFGIRIGSLYIDSIGTHYTLWLVVFI